MILFNDNELLFSVMEDVQFIDIMSMDILDEGTTYKDVKNEISAIASDALKTASIKNKAYWSKDYKTVIKYNKELLKKYRKALSLANSISEDDFMSKQYKKEQVNTITFAINGLQQEIEESKNALKNK